MNTKNFFRFVLEAGKGLTAKMGAAIFTLALMTLSLNAAAASSTDTGDGDKDNVYVRSEVMPEFPGGTKALQNYLQSNVRYPVAAAEDGIQGCVYVQFIITKDGSVADVHIARQCDPILAAEALRVVRSMPDWLPGTINSQAVNVVYTVPITFRFVDTK